MSHNKKAKTSSSLQALASDFDAVRAHLLACPHVSPDSAAIQAALQGLETEQKRLERDFKLQQKFMNDAVTVEKPKEDTTALEFANTSAQRDYNPTAKASTIHNDDNIMTDDWQDISTEQPPEDKKGGSDDESSSFLGQQLAKQVIATLAQHQVKVRFPFEAVALALHAALCSETLGFRCTGIPQDTTMHSGFAAPIRELPLEQLLPDGWNKRTDGSVRFRYRKDGTGSLLLVVQQTGVSHGNGMQVSLIPTSAPEPPSETLKFSLEEYVNLDSFGRALEHEELVAPALHYKALPTLLTRFCQTFDLGQVIEESAVAQALPYVDTTIQNLPSQQQQPPSRTTLAPPPYRTQPPWDEDGTTPTIDDSFPLRSHQPPGDFAGDLTPGGIVGPDFGSISPGQGGMVMGPNHPMFSGVGGGVSGVGPDSGMGMRPRFDPFGPPGGPTEPGFPDGGRGRGRGSGRGRGPGRPGGSGDPNPDHQRPPNDLGHNMFM